MAEPFVVGLDPPSHWTEEPFVVWTPYPHPLTGEDDRGQRRGRARRECVLCFPNVV